MFGQQQPADQTIDKSLFREWQGFIDPTPKGKTIEDFIHNDKAIFLCENVYFFFVMGMRFHSLGAIQIPPHAWSNGAQSPAGSTGLARMVS